jgi:hypothetical protein
MVEELQSAFKDQPASLDNIPGLVSWNTSSDIVLLISQGDLVRALEAEVGGVLISLRNQVPAVGDSLANSPDLLSGTLGGILDNLLGGGLSNLGQ